MPPLHDVRRHDMDGTTYRMIVTNGVFAGRWLFSFTDFRYCVELSDHVSAEWLREDGAPDAPYLARIINTWMDARQSETAFDEAKAGQPELLDEEPTFVGSLLTRHLRYPHGKSTYNVLVTEGNGCVFFTWFDPRQSVCVKWGEAPPADLEEPLRAFVVAWFQAREWDRLQALQARTVQIEEVVLDQLEAGARP